MENHWLIVGLGNPGLRYQNNRHNVGFMIIDLLYAEINQQTLGRLSPWKKQHQAEFCEWQKADSSFKTFFLKPQTYMNRSGDAVIAFLQYYKISSERLLVIHDELDLPFGQMRLVNARGHGGQNGVRHIHESLGHNQYSRLRYGIGRPPTSENGHPTMGIADWVLSDFANEEMGKLREQAPLFLKLILDLQDKGYSVTASWVNRS
ncbi:MAG: aminoacyl-tRNA hydrolase [Bdellovibrionaceae bacterium]|nr:aminoacyl-tRNA hydrolase [Pseudobdellovibrionaceae bacterium]